MDRSGVEVVASISEIRAGHHRLEVDSQFGTETKDDVSADRVVVTLIKRSKNLAPQECISC
jgi:hypothetical protein